MKKTAEVIVVGQGADGIAATCQLAKRGMDVIGLDQFSPPHDRGSHGGETRITRLACGEGSIYTPLAFKSHRIWRELEEEMEWKERLYLPTGALMIGLKGADGTFHGKKDFVGSTVRAASRYNIRHRIHSWGDIRSEFPLFHARMDEYGYYEPDAGIVFPEACIEAQRLAATNFGAAIHNGVKVHSISQEGTGVVLDTSAGEFSAGNCIIAAGAFVRPFLPEPYRKLFKIIRQVQYWYEPREFSDLFAVEKFPVFIWERMGIYGFPDLGNGLVKVALGERTEETDPSNVSRIVAESEFQEMEKVLSQSIPSLNGKRSKAVTCMYTQTPDSDFVIDWHPEMGNVIVVSACSGHGFKHSAAVGEVVAEIITGENVRDNIGYMKKFSFDRFKNVL